MGIKCLKRKQASQRFWVQASGLPVAAPALRSLRFGIDCIYEMPWASYLTRNNAIGHWTELLAFAVYCGIEWNT